MRALPSRRFGMLAACLLLTGALALLCLPLVAPAHSAPPHAVARQSVDPPAFSFAAGGDIGGNSTTTAALAALAAAGTSFFLAIGDMSYGDIMPESAWCSFVQQHVGAAYPFELLAGNHEETAAGTDGFIDTFAGCLPDRLGAVGQYGHQYYFDYPPGAPLARFILIDPNLYRGAAIAEYCRSGDTANCDWLKARIDEAKAQGLWTVVGMHKVCITIGIKSCSIGAPLLNVLVERKVDLILQAHDHGYQRSKQFSLGTGCKTFKAYAYYPGCVVDDGSDGVYNKGAGPVVVIAANVGQASYARNPADAEAPYFATWMDPALNSTGFMKFTVSRDAIDAQFVAATGTYSDHFLIAAAGTPPPTPSATATTPPTSVPTATAVPTAGPTATPEPTTVPTATSAPTAVSTTVPTTEPTSTSTSTSTSTPTVAPTSTPTVAPTATSVPTSVPGAQLSFNPSGDTYVRSDFPNSSYGSNTALRVVGSPIINTYLKFTVSGLGGAPRSAKVRLYVTDPSNSGGAIYSVANNYNGTNTPWLENGLKYSNAPAIAGPPLSAIGSVALDTWVEFDVTAAVTGDGTYSFALASPASNSVLYSAANAGTNKPVLVITPGTPAVQGQGAAPAAAAVDLYVDSDGDGLGDAEEGRYGSDPGRTDSDGDGLPDLAQAELSLDRQAAPEEALPAGGDQIYLPLIDR